jgi:hypothetical protein
MSYPGASPRIEHPGLPCECILYRAMRKATWIDEETGLVKADAFIRRSRANGNDADGLSVNVVQLCTLEECIGTLRKCHGVATLHAGRIRGISLDVEPDHEDNKHALITGLPYPEDDSALAERLAGLLAIQARLVWKP